MGLQKGLGLFLLMEQGGSEGLLKGRAEQHLAM